jgi:hypothetical protein
MWSGMYWMMMIWAHDFSIVRKCLKGRHSRHLDDLINWRDLVRSLDKGNTLEQIQFERAKLGILMIPCRCFLHCSCLLFCVLEICTRCKIIQFIVLCTSSGNTNLGSTSIVFKAIVSERQRAKAIRNSYLVIIVMVLSLQIHPIKWVFVSIRPS